MIFLRLMRAAPSADSQLEKVQKIPISELVPFKNHPFKVVDDEAMLRTTESIAQFGVLTPLIARPLEDGGYEIISGHRRAHAAEAAGLMEVQGERTDLQGDGTSTQVVSKLRSNEQLGEQNNQSRETVRRFIRLTNLIPELLDMVDQKQISFNPAVELSYLTPEEQQHVIEAMDFTQAAPSLSQAQRLKKLSQEGGCTLEAMQDILGEVKKGDLERVAFKSEQLRKYFPKSYSPKQMQDIIIKLLEQWQRKRQREQSL